MLKLALPRYLKIASGFAERKLQIKRKVLITLASAGVILQSYMINICMYSVGAGNQKM